MFAGERGRLNSFGAHVNQQFICARVTRVIRDGRIFSMYSQSPGLVGGNFKQNNDEFTTNATEFVDSSGMQTIWSQSSFFL